MRPPVPADAYTAARKVYIGSAPDVPAADAVVRAWAIRRWPKGIPADAYTLAFWVMSIAMQEGYAASISANRSATG